MDSAPVRKAARTGTSDNWLPDWSTAGTVRDLLRDLHLVDDVIALINGFCKQQVVLLIGGYQHNQKRNYVPCSEYMIFFSPEPNALPKNVLEIDSCWSRGPDRFIYYLEELVHCVVGQRVYRFNEGNRKLEAWDLQSNQAIPCVEMRGRTILRPILRGPVAVGRFVYLIGVAELFNESGGTTRVLRYDTTVGEWAIKSPYLGSCCPDLCRATAVGQSIYVVEESLLSPPIAVASSLFGKHKCDKLWEYRTETDEWIQRSSRMESTFDYGYTADPHKGLLFVCGGTTTTLNADGSGAVRVCDKYTIDKDRWERMPPLSFPRFRPTAVFVDSMLLVIGGMDKPRSIRKDCEMWDEVRNEWVITPHILPRRTVGAAAVVL